MFVLILIAVVSLMHGYLFLRIASLPLVSHYLPGKWFWSVALVLWLLFVLGAVYGHDGHGGLAGWMERIAMDWLGVLFISSSVMLGIDLLTGFGLWARSYLVRLRSIGLLLAGLMVSIALVQGGRAPVVVQYEVALPGLPQVLDGTKVAVLSDLHLGSQLGAPWLAARIQQVKALNADMILLLGDIFEGHGKPNPELTQQFQQLKAPLGVYAVTGNHEFHGDTGADIAMTERAGVVWLRDRRQEVAPGLFIAGVDDRGVRRRKGETNKIIGKLMDGPRQGATILLSHSSWQAEEAAENGVGLMFSGHTHGGQIWPFGYVVRQYYPLFAGRYDVSGMTVIVSRGTGLWGPRMRLWRPGEILEVTLNSQ